MDQEIKVKRPRRTPRYQREGWLNRVLLWLERSLRWWRLS